MTGHSATYPSPSRWTIAVNRLFIPGLLAATPRSYPGMEGRDFDPALVLKVWVSPGRVEGKRFGPDDKGIDRQRANIAADIGRDMLRRWWTARIAA